MQEKHRKTQKPAAAIAVPKLDLQAPEVIKVQAESRLEDEGIDPKTGAPVEYDRETGIPFIDLRTPEEKLRDQMQELGIRWIVEGKTVVDPAQNHLRSVQSLPDVRVPAAAQDEESAMYSKSLDSAGVGVWEDAVRSLRNQNAFRAHSASDVSLASLGSIEPSLSPRSQNESYSRSVCD